MRGVDTCVSKYTQTVMHVLALRTDCMAVCPRLQQHTTLHPMSATTAAQKPKGKVSKKAPGRIIMTVTWGVQHGMQW